MHGLSFVVAALAAAQASAEAQDNGYYFMPQEQVYGPQYMAQAQYVDARPRYAEVAPRYVDERAMYGPEYGRYMDAPRYVEGAQYAGSPYYPEGHHEIVHEPVHHAREDLTRYVEIPEALYDRYIADKVHNEDTYVHHEAAKHQATGVAGKDSKSATTIHHAADSHHETGHLHEPIIHEDVRRSTEHTRYGDLQTVEVMRHESPDYSKHYSHDYYFDPEHSVTFETGAIRGPEVTHAAYAPKTKT